MQASLEKDPEQIKAIHSIRKLGYEVSKVDVNNSKLHEWNFVDNSWLPPLTSLKGLGDAGGAELIARRPEGGFKSIKDFFFNEHGVWCWSKMNKKCIEVLIKMEGFNSIDDIGATKSFYSYGHLFNFLFKEAEGEDKRFDKIKKGKISFDDVSEADPTDFTSAEKIIFQKEIIGYYDKSLIIGKYLDLFEKFDIESVDFDEEDGSKPKVWAVVENIQEAVTANNKKYYRITVSGFSSKEIHFKAWIKEEESRLWAIGNVLVFGLDYSPDWGYSLSRKSKVLKVTK
jgi:DNA polymerase III alpha subunit